MAANVGPKIICLKCRMEMPTLVDLSRHYKMKHKKDDMERKKTFVCPMMCLKTYAHRKGLKSHFTTVHSDIPWEDSYFEMISTDQGQNPPHVQEEDIIEGEEADQEGPALVIDTNGDPENGAGNFEMHYQEDGENGERKENDDEDEEEDDDEEEEPSDDELTNCKKYLDELKKEKDKAARRLRKADRMAEELAIKIKSIEEKRKK